MLLLVFYLLNYHYIKSVNYEEKVYYSLGNYPKTDKKKKVNIF